MKKLINDPNQVVRESIEGLTLAYPQYVRQVEGLQAVVRRDAPVRNKVAVLSGGGSGHEPMHGGFVGFDRADGSVAGNIFILRRLLRSSLQRRRFTAVQAFCSSTATIPATR